MTVSRTLPWLIAALVMSAGCSSVRSSFVATGTTHQAIDPSQVVLAATFVPEGAREVAVVEAHANFHEGFEDVMDEFREVVGRSGGNFGKVDSVQTRFEMQSVTQSQTYQCGSPGAQAICTRRSSQQMEVGITTITGRAFLVGAAR